MTDLVADLKELYKVSQNWSDVAAAISPVEAAAKIVSQDPFTGIDAWHLDRFIPAYRNFASAYFEAIKGASAFATQMSSTIKDVSLKYADQEGINQASFIQ